MHFRSMSLLLTSPLLLTSLHWEVKISRGTLSSFFISQDAAKGTANRITLRLYVGHSWLKLKSLNDLQLCLLNPQKCWCFFFWALKSFLLYPIVKGKLKKHPKLNLLLLFYTVIFHKNRKICNLKLVAKN